MGTASKSMYIRCMENKATNTVTNDQGKVRLSLVHDSAFVNAIETMKNFYFEMNPDIDMCYDYICEVAGCSSFVDDKKAWDMFYDVWDSFQYD
jgi:hypothetical protein